MGRKIIIKGVGKLMARKPGGKEILTLGTLQSLRIDMSTEAEDIFGGDGTFPIDQLIRQKLIEITATDAKFDLAAASIMLGDEIRDSESTTLWSLDEAKRVREEDMKLVAILNYAVAGGIANMSARIKDTGKLVTIEDVVDVEEAGRNVSKVILSDEDVEEGDIVVFNYQYKVSNVEVMDIFRDTVPYPVHVVHHGAFQQKDGKIRGVETELYQCLARGSFTIDAQRATASASTITLQVMDPEVECGKLGSIKTFELDKIPCIP